MIFIANTADASASNIGQISLKSIDDVQQSTLDLLAVFGKTWSDDAVIGIDEFLKDFEALSFRSKIKLLYVPMMIPQTTTPITSSSSFSNSIYLKNIADLNNDLDINSSFLGASYAEVNVTNKGIMMDGANDGSGTPHANSGINFENTDSLGVYNNSLHFGVYVQANSQSFNAGGAGSFAPYVNINSSAAKINTYNMLEVSQPLTGATINDFFMLNGDITGSQGKSYMEGTAYDVSITNTNNTNLQTALPIISGTNNEFGDSTVSLITAGSYLSDTEAAEYNTLIKDFVTMLNEA